MINQELYDFLFLTGVSLEISIEQINDVEWATFHFRRVINGTLYNTFRRYRRDEVFCVNNQYVLHTLLNSVDTYFRECWKKEEVKSCLQDS